MQLSFAKIPRFEKTLQFLESGFLTKAHRTNADYVRSEIEVSGLSVVQQQLLFDPQTSGGLLLSVAAEHSAAIVEKLKNKFTKVAVIGQVLDVTPTRLEVKN